MKKSVLIALLVITAIFLFSINAGLAQETKPKMRQEIVKLKYVKGNDINNLFGALNAFASHDGRIFPNSGLGLITINDYPENVEKMLVVIREIDVKPADIQFNIQLLLGSEMAEDKPDEALKDDPVIKELKSLLKYKSFSLLDSSMVRAVDGERSGITMGKDAELQLELRPKYIKEEKEELIQVEAALTKRGAIIQAGENARRESTTLLMSNFTLKSGEKTVVGVSKMDGGNKGLILIISGKIIK